MRRERAETIAAQAFAWLAAEEGRLGAFLASTGAGLDDLRARAADPDLLGAVLDFVLQEDPRVLDCAEHLAIAPADLVTARSALPGGALPHWT